MTIFLDNRYTRLYYSIVTKAKARKVPKKGYREKHHIIPRSMGGSNADENIVSLKAREHFLCHRLLTKMVEGENLMKAWAALRAMALMDPHGERLKEVKMTSHLFETLRKKHAQRTGDLVKARWMDPAYKERVNASYGGTERRRAAALKASTPEVNEKKRRARLGKKHSLETRAKMAAARRAYYERRRVSTASLPA